ncbi:MAG: Inorganic diphosphatase [Pedosphaera sp.]|nr:Inorganic diphosphatase [Pedosphaera sp.]
MNYLKLSVGVRVPSFVNAVVEVPLGQANKYEYDPKLQVFRLDRPLYASVHYPCEYGFIPSTLGDDGDALDILVLADRPSFPGCVVEVRPVGMLDMVDQGVADTKILAVAEHNPSYQQIKNYADIYPHLLKEIEHFFTVYKQLENKRTEIAGWRDAAQAKTLIKRCHRRFKKC